jgi:thiol-disulfide isomerase/thioredoxin
LVAWVWGTEMKRNILIAVIVGVLSIGAMNDLFATGGLQINPELLAGLAFEVPDNPAHREYLGLTTKPQFKLADIKGDVLLIELFSMYCPICQAEAPVVNQLYDLIEARPDLKTRLKVLGLGTQNTPFEVEVFRKKYGIRFPLIPDENMSFRSVCTEDIRTPTFVMVKLNEKGKPRVLKTHVGQIKDAKAFLDIISKELPMK